MNRPRTPGMAPNFSYSASYHRPVTPLWQQVWLMLKPKDIATGIAAVMVFGLVMSAFGILLGAWASSEGTNAPCREEVRVIRASGYTSCRKGAKAHVSPRQPWPYDEQVVVHCVCEAAP